MKYITIILVFLLLATASFSQQTDPLPQLTKQDYLKKSKNQRTAAWIIGGSGVVLLSTALVVAVNEATEDFFGIFETEEDVDRDASGVIAIAGLAALGTSIPLFIASGRNKKIAMSMSFKMQHVPKLQNSG